MLRIKILLLFFMPLAACNPTINVGYKYDRLRPKILKSEYPFQTISENLYSLEYNGGFFGEDEKIAYDYLLYASAKLALDNNNNKFELYPSSIKGINVSQDFKNPVYAIKKAKAVVDLNPKKLSSITFDASSVCAILQYEYYEGKIPADAYNCSFEDNASVRELTESKIKSYYNNFIDIVRGNKLP